MSIDKQGKGTGEGAVERNTSRPAEQKPSDDDTNKKVGGILDKNKWAISIDDHCWLVLYQCWFHFQHWQKQKNQYLNTSRQSSVSTIVLWHQAPLQRFFRKGKWNGWKMPL